MAPLTVYGSTESHSSIQRAIQLLGLGTQAFRAVPVGADYRIDLRAVESAIEEDHEAGRSPLCLVGTVGTVNTGAIDDLDGLADIAARHEIWFHVDGAFGAWAMLSPGQRHRLSGLERADSVAFDLHKWMYFPYDAGCVLVRSGQDHREAFSYSASYMAAATRGLAAGRAQQFTEYGPELSRGFRALKIWMGLKEQGADKFRRLIEQNIAQAGYLAELVRAAPDLELLAPASLNVVCLRYRGSGAADDLALNDLNSELLVQLQEGGIAVPSHTMLGGRYAIRLAIANHRSQRGDFEALVREVRRLGREIEARTPERR
jgi:glutamate/tyrosine decarboxylase-like PLP-dependent enzyme